jgi:hypothetical protein
MLGLSNSITSSSYNGNIITEIDFRPTNSFNEFGSSIDTFNQITNGFALVDSNDVWVANSDVFSPQISTDSNIVSVNVTFDILISVLSDSFQVLLAETTAGGGQTTVLKTFTETAGNTHYDITVPKHDDYKYLVFKDNHTEVSSNVTIIVTNCFIKYLSN